MKDVLLNVVKVLALDLVFVLSLFVLLYLTILIVYACKNGKNKKLTKDSIASYSFERYMRVINRNLSQIIKWFIILFAIHLLITFFNSLLSYLRTSITYDNVPILALAIDIITPIFQVISPFYLPKIIILSVGLILYAFIKTCNEVSRQKNNNENIVRAVDNVVNNTSKEVMVRNRKQYKVKMKMGEEISIFTENLQKGFFGIAKFLPKLFIVLTVLIGLNSLFLSVTNITKTFDNYKRIQELNITIKNLSNSESFARVTLINEISRGGKAPIKTYKVDVLNTDGDVISTQSFQLEGEEIVIDSININFDYSRIGNGEKINIAYPYRVYSELVPPSKAKPLTCMYNEENIPVIYMLDKDEILGLSEDVYYSRLKEVFDIIKSEDLSRENGIKSSIGNALHFVMKVNDVIDINIEGTGGISASKHETLFTPEELNEEHPGFIK